MSAPDITLDRKIPHNLAAERAVLGAVLLDRVAFDLAAEVVEPLDFLLDANRRLFAHMVKLAEENRAIDLLTLHDELERAGELEAAGGSAYLGSLVDGVPRVSNVEHYARIVKEKALLRNLIHASNNILAQAFEAEEPAEDVLARAEVAILTLGQSSSAAGALQPISRFIGERVQVLEKLRESPRALMGAPTGLPMLDRATTGYRPPEVHVIGGVPGSGKSSLMLQGALAQAKAGFPVAIFSLEMSRGGDLSDRLLCLESGIPYPKFRDPQFIKEEEFRDVLIPASFRLARLPIFVDDSSGLDAPQLALRIRAAVHRDLFGDGRSVAVIWVDYLQILRQARLGQKRHEAVDDAMQRFHELAKSLGRPIIVLSQLRRPPAGTRDWRPSLHDLKESGGIEEKAHTVHLLYRPYIFSRDETDLGRDELIIAKQRNGPLGPLPVRYDTEHLCFQDRE